MLYGEKSKKDLETKAEKLFREEIISNRRSRRELYDNIFNKFNMPTRIAEEMVTFKRNISEFTPFEIFCVVWFLDRDCLKKYFTPEEIDAFSKDKFDDHNVEFPIIFDNVSQVTDTQWIGTITAQQLMGMKRNGLINYDENEQRALRRVKFGEVDIYKPYVSSKNVNEIKESMLRGTYIPDPITLNMPDGSEYSYADHKLTVYSLPRGMMNLDDGYHRYLAISQIIDFNPAWDYPMELRVVNFSNAKANDFIYQQDQKTPMKRITSASYNTNSVPNKIVSRINDDPKCNIQGMIGKNAANINAAVLAKLIDRFFVKEKVQKEKEMALVLRLQKELVHKFNVVTEQDGWFLEPYDDAKLLTTMYIFASDIPEDKYGETIRGILDGLDADELKAFNISTTNSVRKKAVNIIQSKIYE